MDFNIKNYEKDLLFIPLGGTNKIGANLYVYHYKGKFVIVDFGCGFANDAFPGVEITVPDISFLLKHKKDILGIVLTHGHEDHIGALQHLWNELGCNIYATPFTATLLKERFLDNNFKHSGKIITVGLKDPTFSLLPFKIEMVPLCHSIPEMHAVILKTDVGNIFHTGDWKFDSNPLIGKQNDESKLKKYGDEGILAVVSDSTNVFNTEPSGSEGELKKSLLKLIKPCKEMVVIASFSSNVARFEALIDIAKLCKRKVVLSGRSLRRMFSVGVKSGYLKNAKDSDLVDERDIDSYDRSKLLVIATGCQGEPFASVTKLASQTHPFIKLNAGDTIIFSSKVIPGNDIKIYRVFDKLVSLKVDIIMEKTEFTHVSGHPSQAELKRLYGLLRPKILIPTHGEQFHLYQHIKLAPSFGIKNSLLISDGDVVRFKAEGKAEKVGKVQAQELAVYGNYYYSHSSPVMQMRRNLRDGICAVVLLVSDKGELQSEPVLIFPGFLDEDHERSFIEFIRGEIVLLVNSLRTSRKRNMDSIIQDLEKKVKAQVKSLLKHEVKKVPVMRVVVRVV
jgi:ribonuclease J